MNIEPRVDAYRPLADPSKVIVVATGVIAGKLKTMGIELRADHPDFSDDEDGLIRAVRPLIDEWWNSSVEEAASAA